MKRNVSVVKLCLYVSECVCSKIMSICVCSKIIKKLPGLVGSGTPYILRTVSTQHASRQDAIITKLGDIWLYVSAVTGHLQAN